MILSDFKEVNKGGFFSECAMCFSNLQISKKNIPKNYPELEIQISRQLQYTEDSLLEYFYFGDLEIWKFEKRIALSEKSHL